MPLPIAGIQGRSRENREDHDSLVQTANAHEPRQSGSSTGVLSAPRPLRLCDGRRSPESCGERDPHSRGCHGLGVLDMAVRIYKRRVTSRGTRGSGFFGLVVAVNTYMASVKRCHGLGAFDKAVLNLDFPFVNQSTGNSRSLGNGPVISCVRVKKTRPCRRLQDRGTPSSMVYVISRPVLTILVANDAHWAFDPCWYRSMVSRSAQTPATLPH
jgi:hypothetical protein